MQLLMNIPVSGAPVSRRGINSPQGCSFETFPSRISFCVRCDDACAMCIRRRRRRRRRLLGTMQSANCVRLRYLLTWTLVATIVVLSIHHPYIYKNYWRVDAFQAVFKSIIRCRSVPRQRCLANHRRLYPATSPNSLAVQQHMLQPQKQQLQLISMTSLLEDYSEIIQSGSSKLMQLRSADSNATDEDVPNSVNGDYSSLLPPAYVLPPPQEAVKPQRRQRRGLLSFFFRPRNGNEEPMAKPITSHSLWRHRHARSAEEGIRHELTSTSWTTNDSDPSTKKDGMAAYRKNSARRLSSVLAKASLSVERTSRRMAARTLTGLITALAEEVVDLAVEVDARDDTPYYNKHITAVRIKFARLGFKPLRMGGHETKPLQQQRQFENQLLLNSFQRRSALDRKLIGVTSWDDDDEYDEVMTTSTSDGSDSNSGVMELQTLTADEAFDRIDADKSGYLDRDELVQALSLAARTRVDNVTIAVFRDDEVDNESNLPILQRLASDLFELYDINGDGVVDRREYKTMVDDMAALRKAQELRERRHRDQLSVGERDKDDNHGKGGWTETALGLVQNYTAGFFHSGVELVQNKTSFLSGGVEFVQNKSGSVLGSGLEFVQNHSGWLPWRRLDDSDRIGTTSELARNAMLQHNGGGDSSSIQLAQPPELVESVSKSLGSITFSDVKMDLRRLFFGAIPILKHIVPGGPLILEPFTTTVTGSFDRHDIMNSVLLDAGLRRLVMRALRRRVGFLRDFLEGAMFKGRSWKTYSGDGPKVDIPELTNVEFDSNDKLIITGRARVKTSPDSSVIEQSFKVRTSIGTRKNGRFIRLEKPELALVIECPKAWDANLEKICKALDIEKPPRFKPIYTFFPIYSPFKLEEDDGFDLGHDNSITSLVIKDGALRFEMSAVLRPGRFLGSHYIAFTTPIRTFIVTLDRVTEGIRSARKGKKAARALALANERLAGNNPNNSRRRRRPPINFDRAEDALLARQEMRMKNAAVPTQKSKVKSFFSRFVDGYLQAERDDAKKERLTTAIRDFFGRQSG